MRTKRPKGYDIIGGIAVLITLGCMFLAALCALLGWGFDVREFTEAVRPLVALVGVFAAISCLMMIYEKMMGWS